MMCTYMLNSLLACRTFIHFCTYMFLCDYSVFRSIENLFRMLSNNYCETKNQRLGIGYPLNPVCFMFTTILHHITNAASNKLPLYKNKGRDCFIINVKT